MSPPIEIVVAVSKSGLAYSVAPPELGAQALAAQALLISPVASIGSTFHRYVLASEYDAARAEIAQLKSQLARLANDQAAR
jgi:predicted alpha/beta hydrolase family esterase